MSFHDEMRELCSEIVACECEEEVVQIARRLREMVHAHMEEQRRNLLKLPPIGHIQIDKAA
jgi:hypothetical protein